VKIQTESVIKNYFEMTDYYRIIIIGLALFLQNLTQAQELDCLSMIGDHAADVVVESEECIEIGGDSEYPTTLHNGRLEARSKITVKTPSYLRKYWYPGGLNLKLDRTTSVIQIINPTEIIGKHEKVEIGINLNKELADLILAFKLNNSEGVNPFNPEEISIEASFTSPSSRIRTRYGFYYEDYSIVQDQGQSRYELNDSFPYDFIIRNSLDEIGNWEVDVRVIVNGEIVSSRMFGIRCISSNKKGRLITTSESAEKDRYFRFKDSPSGDRFFGIGANICHSGLGQMDPGDGEIHRTWLENFLQEGGNLVRIELGGQNYLPNWDQYNNYFPRLARMTELDGIIENIASYDAYFILFRHHTEMWWDQSDPNRGTQPEGWDGLNWLNNPFIKADIINNRRSYFKSGEAEKWQNHCLRYIISRWGYTPSFMAYEYQEMDNWLSKVYKEENVNYEKDEKFIDGELREIQIDVRKWLERKKNFLQNELNSEVLFSIAYATLPEWEKSDVGYGLCEVSDFQNVHKYGGSKDVNYLRRKSVEELWDRFKQPVFVEECGVHEEYTTIQCCTDLNYHNSIWAPSVMGAAGTGMAWNWKDGYFDNFKPISTFFGSENFEAFHYNKVDVEFDKYQSWRTGVNKVAQTKLEFYFQRDKEKNRALGWIHNATNYWHNLGPRNSCMNDLLVHGIVEPSCIHNNEGNSSEVFTKLNHENNRDHFYDVQDLSGNDKNLIVSGFKWSTRRAYSWISDLFGKTKYHWYQIDYYSTIAGAASEIVKSHVVSTSLTGNIELSPPNLIYPVGDFGVKIRHRGFREDKPSASILVANDDSLQDVGEVYFSPSADSSSGFQADKEMVVQQFENPLKDTIQRGIKVFPNPVNNSEFTISLYGFNGPNKPWTATLIDPAGRRVFSYQFSRSIEKIKIDEVKSGVYLLFITYDGYNEMKRVVVLK